MIDLGCLGKADKDNSNLRRVEDERVYKVHLSAFLLTRPAESNRAMMLHFLITKRPRNEQSKRRDKKTHSLQESNEAILDHETTINIKLGYDCL